MTEEFSPEQFRDAFTTTQKIKNKLQPFIAKCKESNMKWMVRSFQQLHQLFFDEKTDIVLKFNSIFGIKFFFDTGDVLMINLIEIYFLPRLLQIAGYDVKGPEDKRGTSYFFNNGYPKTAEAQKFGYNFVRMASQFIYTAATVKPRRLFEVDQLNDASQFSMALKKLQEAGWKPYAAPAYYKEGSAQLIKALFQKSAKEITDQSIENYTEYFKNIFRKIITEEKPYPGRLDPMKLLQFGDAFVTVSVIEVCGDLFRTNNLKHKKSALSMLNYLIRCGDIQAAHLVNCTELLDDVLRQIANPEVGSKNLSRGKNMFKQIKVNEQLKQDLYVEVLKDIQFWSLCFPLGIKDKNRPSKIKNAHDQLRNKLQIQFPEDKDLKQNKAIFDEFIVKNKKRNQKLLQLLEGNDPVYQSLLPPLHANNPPSLPVPGPAPNNPYLPSTMKSSVPESKPLPVQNSKKINQQTPHPLEGFDTIKREIMDVKISIDTLCESQAKADPKIAKIVGFQEKHNSYLENAELTSQQFDQLLLTGEEVIGRIDKIMPHIQKYKAKKITFQQFTDLILQVYLNQFKRSSPIKSKQVKKQPQEIIRTKQQLLKVQSPLKSNILKKQQKIQNLQPVLHSQQKNKQDSVLKHIGQQITPIKMHDSTSKKQARQSKDMSSLPEISKHSVQKSEHQSPVKPSFKKQTKQLSEDINIRPASHTIIGEKQKVKQQLFKHQKQQKLMQASLKHDQHKVHPPSPIKQLQSKHKAKQLDSQQLQHQIEQNIGINPPKSLKNITGSYKIKSQIRQQTPLNQKVLKNSHVSSRKQQQVKFQQSVSGLQINKEDQDDMIIMPDNNPLQRSFHQLGKVEDIIKQSKVLSFKKCFEDDKYLFGQDRNSKKFWLANDTISLIRPASNSRRQSRNKESTVSIPDILNERNKKFQQELKYVEEKKNRKINQLQSKIKNLEHTGTVLKEKLVEKDHQIKLIRASSQAEGSRVKQTSLLQDQDIMFKAKLASVAKKSVKERSFYDESRKQPRFTEPLGKLINSRKYDQYFQQFQSEKHKKNILKNKQLLLKNDNIQFGCMTRRDKETLVVTFFITPALDLSGLVCKVNSVNNLQTQVQPNNVPSIRKGKQEKVIVIVNITNIPFKLPTIQFSYNVGQRLQSQSFLIPCAFHKFIAIAAVDEKQIQKRFEKGDNVLRGEEVPYSKKLLKNMSSLSDYFPNGALLNNGNTNNNSQIQFGGKARWKYEQFFIRIMVKYNQFLYVQTVSQKPSLAQQYFVSLVTNLLMKNIDLKEM